MYMQNKISNQHITALSHKEERVGLHWVKLAPFFGRNINLHIVYCNILLKFNLNWDLSLVQEPLQVT